VLGVDHPYEVKSDDTPSLLPDKAIAVRFHSVGGGARSPPARTSARSSATSTTCLYDRDKVVDEFGKPQGNHSRQRDPKYGSEKKGARRLLHDRGARAHPGQLRPAPRQRRPLLRPKALHPHQPLDAWPRAAASCGNRTRRRGRMSGAALGAEADHRQEDPGFTLPGFKIAREATDRGDLQLRMQGNAFLGAFFSVSPMLRIRHHAEQSATQSTSKASRSSQARGRGRDSNMEVMTKGFELVREIRLARWKRPIARRCAARRCCRMAMPVSIAASEGCGTGCRPSTRPRASRNARR